MLFHIKWKSFYISIKNWRCNCWSWYWSFRISECTVKITLNVNFKSYVYSLSSWYSYSKNKYRIKIGSCWYACWNKSCINIRWLFDKWTWICFNIKIWSCIDRQSLTLSLSWINYLSHINWYISSWSELSINNNISYRSKLTCTISCSKIYNL